MVRASLGSHVRKPSSAYRWSGVFFPRVLRFSPTFDERSARYKWNILERVVKPKSPPPHSPPPPPPPTHTHTNNVFLPTTAFVNLAAPSENKSPGMCGQRRSKSDCASAWSDQGPYCPLIESLDTTDCINREQIPVKCAAKEIERHKGCLLCIKKKRWSKMNKFFPGP